MKIKELLSVYTLRTTAISTLLSACFFAPVLFAIKCDDCGKEIDPTLPSYCSEGDYKHLIEVLGQNLQSDPHRRIRHLADDFHHSMQSSRLSAPSILIVVDTSSSPVAPGELFGISPLPRWIADTPEKSPSPSTDDPPRLTRCSSHHSPEELTHDEQVQRARVDIRHQSIQNVFTVHPEQSSTNLRALTHITEIGQTEFNHLFFQLEPALRRMLSQHGFGAPTPSTATGPLQEGYQFYATSLPADLEPQAGASIVGKSQQGVTQVIQVGERRHLQPSVNIDQPDLYYALGGYLAGGHLTAVRFTNEVFSLLIAFEGVQPEEPGRPTTHSTVRIPLLSRNYPSVAHRNIIALVNNIMERMGINSIDISELLTDEHLNPPVVHQAPPNATDQVPSAEEVRPPELQFTLPSWDKSPG